MMLYSHETVATEDTSSVIMIHWRHGGSGHRGTGMGSTGVDRINSDSPARPGWLDSGPRHGLGVYPALGHADPGSGCKLDHVFRHGRQAALAPLVPLHAWT